MVSVISEVVPVRLLMAVATPNTIVELSDGTYRWWNLDTRRPMETGPTTAWVHRGLTANSVTWNGPSIQEMPMSALLIRSSQAVAQ